MRARTFSMSMALAMSAASLPSHAEGMAAWMAQLLRMQSAYRVVGKNVQINEERKSNARVHAMQSTAQAANEAYNNVAVLRTVDTFGPNSQLVDPCYQVAMAGMTTTTKGKTDASAQRAMMRIYETSDTGFANAGGVTGVFGATHRVSGYSYAASVSNRVQRHLARYCTVAEANAGYCTLQANGMQGGDSDFSVHLAPGKTYGWDQLEAATDFVKTVAPVRPVSLAEGCTDAGCRSAFMARRQQEAYMSMARYSMARFVESRSTQVTGDAKRAVTQ